MLQVGTDRYPIEPDPFPRVTNDNPIPRYAASGVGRVVDMANELMDSARPLWQVIQAHNLRFFYPYCHGCRTPTLQEQRSMAWQSIVRGANGIVSAI